MANWVECEPAVNGFPASYEAEWHGLRLYVAPQGAGYNVQVINGRLTLVWGSHIGGSPIQPANVLGLAKRYAEVAAEAFRDSVIPTVIKIRAEFVALVPCSKGWDEMTEEQRNAHVDAYMYHAPIR